jgi:hypothetical protein
MERVVEREMVLTRFRNRLRSELEKKSNVTSGAQSCQGAATFIFSLLAFMFFHLKHCITIFTP